MACISEKELNVNEFITLLQSKDLPKSLIEKLSLMLNDTNYDDTANIEQVRTMLKDYPR